MLFMGDSRVGHRFGSFCWGCLALIASDKKRDFEKEEKREPSDAESATTIASIQRFDHLPLTRLSSRDTCWFSYTKRTSHTFGPTEFKSSVFKFITIIFGFLVV